MTNESQHYLDAVKSLKNYFHSTLRSEWDKAHSACLELVELAKKLEDHAFDQVSLLKPITKKEENDNRIEPSGDSSSVNGGNTETD